MSEQAWPEWESSQLELRFPATHYNAEYRVMIGQSDYEEARIARNAMLGIPDPAALRKRLDDLRAWRVEQLPDNPDDQVESLHTIVDDLFDLIPQPTEAPE